VKFSLPSVRFDELLYSRRTASFLVIVSALALTASMTHIVRDVLAWVSPDWHPLFHWIGAIGFDTGILAVGLVIALTGRTWQLVVAEIFLIAVSVTLGVGSAIVSVSDRGGSGAMAELFLADGSVNWSAMLPFVMAVATGLMAVQYVFVVTAGHRLAHARLAPVARRTAKKTASPSGTPSAKSTAKRGTSVGSGSGRTWQQLVAEYPGMSVEQMAGQPGAPSRRTLYRRKKADMNGRGG